MRIPLLAFALLPTLLAAGDRGPSTPEERARLVRFVAVTAEHPATVPDAGEARWAIKFVEEIPDYSVTICRFDAIKEFGTHPDYRAVSTAYFFAPFTARFEHPESRDDEPAMSAATWSLMVTIYVRLRESGTSALPTFEKAAAARKAGREEEFFRLFYCAKQPWHRPPLWARDYRPGSPVAPPAAASPAAAP